LPPKLWKGLLLLLVTVVPSVAERQPVLKQIAHPHPYYYREMYLPQLTTGPSGMAWGPDSASVIYSKAGSLWRQQLGADLAEELTHGPGYDYQPDWSPDGRWVVYAKYDKDAVELWVLDLQNMKSRAITQGGAVNVEPRFSPDSKRLVFVSTSYNGRFHVFAGDFADGELKNVQRLTGENKSPLPRYYYSPFDHEISPVWSRDGSEILFVSNRGHIYGTGGFWRMKAVPGAEPHEIHYEETTWKARPDLSPDGKRLVYASYLGQPWHQLWEMPAEGGDPFPISYGDYDNVNPRWSPDGKQIAFISNRGGNTSLWVQQAWGGGQKQIVAREHHWLGPTGKFRITLDDVAGRPTAARVSVTGSDGRAYAPNDSWMHADDNFDRAQHSEEAHYFHCFGSCEITLPVGRASVEITKGLEFGMHRTVINIRADRTLGETVRLRRNTIPNVPGSRWVSGDVHVHMNYGGAYRNTPANLVKQSQAEDLSIVESLVVNKEQRVPDIAYFRTSADAASTRDTLILPGQEFHTSYWGHLGLLHLTRNFVLPDYAAYVNTAAASLFPANADVADQAHEQKGAVGYVHPFETAPDPAKDERLTNELPVDIALGKVDYIEVVGFADHKATAEVWYRLLNLGFRLPTAAGTDAMANFASLRGPVGLNRVYVAQPAGPLNAETWLTNLRAGKTFATNGPLIGFTLGGTQVGGELKLATSNHEVKYTAWLRSIVPVDHLQLVCNGEVMKELEMSADHTTADLTGTIPISRSGWCVLRAWSEKPEDPVLDLYPYATTSPVYVSVAGAPQESPKDAAYFVAWINRLVEAAKAHTDWNNDAEKKSVMEMLEKARVVYEGKMK
jgi:TolB protein